MMKKGLGLLGLVGLLATLSGCADPAVGHWVCSDNTKCGDSEFTVEDDLEGDGDGLFSDGVNSIQCSFDVKVEDTGDSNYNVIATFTGQCAPFDKVDDDCRINDGVMDCDDFGEFTKDD